MSGKYNENGEKLRKFEQKWPHSTISPKRSMKYVWICLISLLGCSGCASELRLEKAVASGQNTDSKVVTHTELYFKKPSSAIVKIDQIWLGEREKGWWLEYSIAGAERNTKSVEKGARRFSLVVDDRIAVNGPDANGPQRVRPFAHPPTQFPENYTHGYLVFYTMDGKSLTLSVEKLDSLSEGESKR
jgi:hypothetical protein